jgi:hypothetical protein
VLGNTLKNKPSLQDENFLEWERILLFAPNFLPGGEKLFAPWLALALRTRIDDVADAEAVIALVPRCVRRELFAFRTQIVELALERLMVIE